VPLGVALSGGLDSTLLLALAVEAEIPVHAFTVAESADDPELAVAERAAREAGVPHEVLLVPPAEQPGFFRDAVHAARAFVFNGRGVLGVPLYRAMAARGVSSAISGLGADEIYLASAVEPFLARVRADWAVEAELCGRPAFAPPADVPPRALAVELALRAAIPIEVPVAAAAGVSLSLPFLDDALIAAATSVPEEILRDKAPLRWLAARRGGVLAELATRRKLPRYAPVGHPAWAELFAELLAPPRLHALGLDPARVRALRDAWHRGGPDRDTLDRVLMKIASLSVLAAP